MSAGAQLTLHSGAQVATRAEVLDVRTPDATETWQPVPHGFLIDGFLSRLESIGFGVQREQHGLTRDGARWFGVFDLVARSAERDYSLAIGLRNSHDQSFAAAAMMGSRVWICDNLAMSGEVRIIRKHTSEILNDLPDVMDEAVVKLSSIEDFMRIRIDHYKASELTDAQVHDFLVRSTMAKVLPVTRLPLVYAEWHRPRHDDFRPRTAWSLFNGFTEVFKGTSLFKMPARTQRLHLLLDRFVGTPKPAPAPELTLADLRARAAAASSN